ncbi:baseplate J/gp47 family protein [Pseudoxanthomonas sp. UTMC 1351]|uniref:baseplate J/gp47 family protein n=1 Tax=Pseudoxanthomonas sp. UTMC 1351 TaxID=2695853 RepID=UPI0034CE3DD1
MPFDRPTLPVLNERIATDLEANLTGTDAHLRRSVLGVLARVLAAATHGLYGFLNWISRQVIPDTAEAEVLERWAALWKLARKPAVAASGPVSFYGNNGVIIPAGTVLQRSDGATFITDAEGVVAGGTVTLSVVAQLAGAAGNSSPGTRLLIAAQILGVQAEAFVAAEGLAGGAEIESDESLRERLLLRLSTPPQGGAAHDYVQWALEVSGVTRAWVVPAINGLGTVGVFVVNDAQANPIPDAVLMQAVTAHIQAKRPVTARVYVLAPIAFPIDMTIAVTPDLPSVRGEVEAELRDLFRREAEPGGTILASHLGEAISLAAGERDHRIDAPVGNVVAPPGYMPVLRAITWTV